MNNELIYFTINNWNNGIHYPDTENFRKLYDKSIDTFVFHYDDYCKEHKLAVYECLIDMSLGYTIVAPMEYVMKYCPEIIGSEFDETNKSGRYDNMQSMFWMHYPEYKKENFCCTIIDYDNRTNELIIYNNEFNYK